MDRLNTAGNKAKNGSPDNAGYVGEYQKEE